MYKNFLIKVFAKMKIYTITLLLTLTVISNIYTQNFWEKTAAPDATTIWSLAINSSGHIFAGTDNNGIFRSVDYGDNWTFLGFTNYQILSIVVSQNGDILVAHLQHGGLRRSTDNGNNWTTLGVDHFHTSLAINSDGNIFLGTGALGVYRSTDNGANWDQINQGLTSQNINSLIINTSGDVFAGTMFGGVFRSTNNGANWDPINTGLTDYNVTSFTINTSGDIFAGTANSGIFRSTDNGANWIQVNTGLTMGEGYRVRSFAINSNGNIFSGTADGVFRSTDNGDNWVQINQGLTNIYIHSLAINSNGNIFAGTEDGVFRSIITANLKVFLEGPYNGAGVMTTTLNTNNLIPLNSNTAYSTVNYGYTASTVASIPNSSIVDWVLVELRTGTAAGTKVATLAGFLKSDGTIVDVDGTSPLQFGGLGDGNYYVVVRHRNHLAIMSASAIPLSSNSALYDFSTSQSQAYGTNPMKSLSGIYGLISGDASGDGQVNVDDRNATWNNKNLVGFRIDDVTLDGQVNVDDRNITWNNKNLSTQIP